MSVEYALMLVVITGAVAGLLRLGLNVPFEKAMCAIQAALSGGSCDGTVLTPAPTTSEPGPDPTGAPTTQAPMDADSTPPCDSTSSTSHASPAGTSQTETTDCTTTTNPD
jgi:hypothetical protein